MTKLRHFLPKTIRLHVAILLVALVPLLLLGARVLAQEGASSSGATVTPRLRAALEVAAAEGSQTVEIVAVLRGQVNVAAVGEAAASAIAASGENDPHARGRAIHDALVVNAQQTQAPLRKWLDAQGITYRSYYLVNMVLVQGDAAIVAALQKRPEIARLALNVATSGLETTAKPDRMHLPAGWTMGARAAQSASLPWGLEFVHASEAWALGYTGDGIVVASQDTGVQWDHPALQAQYRGWDSTTMTVTHPYNWFDAWGADGARASRCAGEAATNPQIPCDDNGHGTHTVGTMVGDARNDDGTILGVAPDAQWIGCRNMTGGVGSPASYADCFQFFLAPYPQGGDPLTDGDPSLAPHIINNSWSCPVREGCDDPQILRTVVETARAAGQFVVSSAGNSGSSCSSVNTPIAIYDAAFSVGAFDFDGSLSGFSSRGPVTVDNSNRIKPDIAAPGSAVYSASLNGGYTTLSGTSMAAPHVAGAVALLWSAAPDLIGDIDRTEEILRQSATWVAYENCGGGSETGTPANNGYGAGRLNLLTAVQLALGTGPVLNVSVVDKNGSPVAGSVVTVVDMTTQEQITATTSAQGVALFGNVATLDWQGIRHLPYVMSDAVPPVVFINASENLFLPFMPCDAEPCLSFAASPAFAVKPRD